MSDKCGNCDCANKSQCVKKGSQYGFVLETRETYDTVFMGAPVAENDCKCKGKCGSSCSCANCSCGCN